MISKAWINHQKFHKMKYILLSQFWFIKTIIYSYLEFIMCLCSKLYLDFVFPSAFQVLLETDYFEALILIC